MKLPLPLPNAAAPGAGLGELPMELPAPVAGVGLGLGAVKVALGIGGVAPGGPGCTGAGRPALGDVGEAPLCAASNLCAVERGEEGCCGCCDGGGCSVVGAGLLEEGIVGSLGLLSGRVG